METTECGATSNRYSEHTLQANFCIVKRSNLHNIILQLLANKLDMIRIVGCFEVSKEKNCKEDDGPVRWFYFKPRPVEV